MNKNNILLNKDTDPFLINRLIKTSIPFLIKGNIDGFSDSLSFRTISKLINKNIEIPVETYKDKFYSMDKMNLQNMTLSTFFQKLDLGEIIYAAEILLEGKNKLEDLKPINRLTSKKYIEPENKKYKKTLFLGRNTITQAHYHTSTEAILSQLIGTKTVFLFHPKNFKSIKPHPFFSSKKNWSSIVFEAENAEIFESKYLEQFDFPVIKYVLQPGDSLYIPLYWFHLVYGKGDNLSFTDFYYSTLKKRIFSTVFLRSIKNC